MIWYNIKEKKPEQNQAVWYYFEHTGLSNGNYEGQDFCDAFPLPEHASPAMFAEHESHRGKCTCNIFYGDHGFLTDDVTHWAEYNYEEYIDAQTSLVEFLVSIDCVPKRYKDFVND